MLSTAMTSAPSMRGARRCRAIVVLPTLPEKLMTATFMGDPRFEEGVGGAAVDELLGDLFAGARVVGERGHRVRCRRARVALIRGSDGDRAPRIGRGLLRASRNLPLDRASADNQAGVREGLADGFDRM